MSIGDVAAVERRVTELSGDAPGIAPQAGTSVAAFAALLRGAGAGAADNGSVAADGDAGAWAASARAPVPSAQLERMIAGASAATGNDVALVKAIIANESGFNPAATSPVGAQGLMQLMPGTAAGLGVRDAYDPAQNIAGGTRYLAELLAHFKGNVPTAVAAYNAGPAAIARGDMPAETVRYVHDVLDSYATYRARASSAQAPVVQEPVVHTSRTSER